MNEKENYNPRRGMTRVDLLTEPLTIKYRNSSNEEVIISDDGREISRSRIRAVWYLHTTDMNRSRMPIVIFDKSGVYDIHYYNGSFIIKSLNYKDPFEMRIGRPITPYHVKRLIEERCSWEEVVDKIGMTEKTQIAWNRARAWTETIE